jgi:acetyl-CoA carboxylase carboxyl transferase subunit alpha
MSYEAILDFEKPIIELEKRLDELRLLTSNTGVSTNKEITQLEKKLVQIREKTFSNLSCWQTTQLARHPRRPYTLDYIKRMCCDFKEFHGDRAFGDDPSIVGGIARLGDRSIMIIGHQKGRDTKSNIYRNFGMPQPEGYRKALRLMKMAERFNIPVVTLVDTPGAYPGLGAEARGQAEAIARNLFEMARLKVPIVTIVIGEGGSGGALALAVSDKVMMLEFSIYSVISPEGCASILFRDAAKANDAAEAMRLVSPFLKETGIVDEIISEPLGGAHRDYDIAAMSVKEAIHRHLEKLCQLDPAELVENRINRFDKLGIYS